MIATPSINTKRMTLLIALLLAVVTGWLTLSYVRSVQSQNSYGAQRTVYVAAADIPARATITSDMLQRVIRPSATVESDAIANPTAAIGQVALITIPAGGSVTESKLGRSADAGLPVRLTDGKRAVSIAIDKVKGVSGLIQPGDHVDVIAVPMARALNDAPPPAATILRGVRILAIGGSIEYVSATPSPQEQSSSTVTLEVTPAQADLLAMADENMKLRLALRPPHEKANSQPTEALRFPSPPVFNQTQSQPAPRIAVAPPANAPAHHASFPGSGIMIIDGDRVGYGHTSSDSQGAGQP
jgi:pilus assembly protein CpaB